MALYLCLIPPITDERGKDWDQPKTSEIKFTSDGYAVLSIESKAKLAEYSTTTPSGVYAGKMWLRKEYDKEYLCWFQGTKDPEKFDIKYRPILLLNVFNLLNPGGEEHL